MKLFKLEIGNTITYAAAESLVDMTDRKEEVDTTFAFLPVSITEMVLDGYEISVTPVGEDDKPRGKGGRPRREI